MKEDKRLFAPAVWENKFDDQKPYVGLDLPAQFLDYDRVPGALSEYRGVGFESVRISPDEKYVVLRSNLEAGESLKDRVNEVIVGVRLKLGVEIGAFDGVYGDETWRYMIKTNGSEPLVDVIAGASFEQVKERLLLWMEMST